jgi:hypothetical protein
MKIFGSIKELVSTVFRQNGKEIELKPNSASYASVTTPVVELPPPDSGTVELVGKTSAQTLTNKTIDGDSNTLQDIAISSIKTVLADADKVLLRDATGAVTSAKVDNDNVDAAAAIAYSKLALSNSIVDGDISTTTAIQDSKLATISTAGKVSGGAITSGTIGGTTSVNTSGTVTASTLAGTLTGSGISGATSVSYASTTAAAGSTVTPIADRPIIVLTTAPSTTISALANSAAGKQVVLINNGLGDLTINNDSGSPASSGIYTGTGTAFTFKSNAAITLTYSSDLSRWVLTGGAGGGSGEAVVTSVNGAASGYAVGTPVYFSSGAVSPADASAANTAEVVGLVESEPSSAVYKVVTYGLITGVPTSAFDTGSYPASFGEVVFLSPTTGKLTISEPNTIGDVSIPLGVYISTGAIYVAVKRGVVVGGTNARTQLTLSSASTTDIFNAQTPTLYQAGELAGWVQLGTSQKFYFRAPFAQNGAGTNWNISPSYVGDTPPAGFSLQMSSAGVISITCPSFAGAGLVNYALNAPAVGATFPLAVDASSLTTGTVAAARLPVVVPGTSAGVVAAAGLPGNTTGSAIAAGYVGEVRRVAASSAVALASSNLVTAVSDTLPAGVWLCFVSIITTVSANGALVYHNITKDVTLLNEKKVVSAGATGDRQFSTFAEVVVSTGSTVVTGRVQATGSVTGSTIDAASEESCITSVRIA